MRRPDLEMEIAVDSDGTHIFRRPGRKGGFMALAGLPYVTKHRNGESAKFLRYDLDARKVVVRKNGTERFMEPLSFVQNYSLWTIPPAREGDPEGAVAVVTPAKSAPLSVRDQIRTIEWMRRVGFRREDRIRYLMPRALGKATHTTRALLEMGFDS